MSLTTWKGPSSEVPHLSHTLGSESEAIQLVDTYGEIVLHTTRRHPYIKGSCFELGRIDRRILACESQAMLKGSVPAALELVARSPNRINCTCGPLKACCVGISGESCP